MSEEKNVEVNFLGRVQEIAFEASLMGHTVSSMEKTLKLIEDISKVEGIKNLEED